MGEIGDGENRWASDIALLVLDRPIDCGGDCIEGYHYLKYWDTDIDGDITGSTFVLTGWGGYGHIREDGSLSDLTWDYYTFHRGYNVVDAIRGNMLRYSMTKPEDGGLDLESMSIGGDRGGGALLEINPDEPDPKLRRHRIVGVSSNGYNSEWRSLHDYTYVGDYHTDWIQANLESLDEQVPADDCGDNGYIYDECRDTNFDADGNELKDDYGDPCTAYVAEVGWCGTGDTDNFNSYQMCCACLGGEDISGDDEGLDGDGNGDGNGDGDGAVPSAEELAI